MLCQEQCLSFLESQGFFQSLTQINYDRSMTELLHKTEGSFIILPLVSLDISPSGWTAGRARPGILHARHSPGELRLRRVLAPDLAPAVRVAPAPQSRHAGCQWSVPRLCGLPRVPGSPGPPVSLQPQSPVSQASRDLARWRPAAEEQLPEGGHTRARAWERGCRQ